MTLAEMTELLRTGYSVLIDSPEEIFITPDLQTAFIQYIEELSKESVYIFTTAPAIIQEVKSEDITIVSGFESTALTTWNPRMETFGENIGIVTTQIFNNEVAKTGYYRKILKVAEKSSDYETALKTFGGELGSEGRALLRSMMIHKSKTKPR